MLLVSPPWQFDLRLWSIYPSDDCTKSLYFDRFPIKTTALFSSESGYRELDHPLSPSTNPPSRFPISPFPRTLHHFIFFCQVCCSDSSFYSSSSPWPLLLKDRLLEEHPHHRHRRMEPIWNLRWATERKEDHLRRQWEPMEPRFRKTETRLVRRKMRVSPKTIEHLGGGVIDWIKSKIGK